MGIQSCFLCTTVKINSIILPLFSSSFVPSYVLFITGEVSRGLNNSALATFKASFIVRVHCISTEDVTVTLIYKDIIKCLNESNLQILPIF